MAEAYLALGANLGDPFVALAEARNRLAQSQVVITNASGLYRTPPFGSVAQPAFINQCLSVNTTLEPHALLDLCLDIERQMGRERAERWGPRRIDIDLLAYGERVIADDRLTLPHPGILHRAFVLVPLMDIAPRLTIAGTAIVDALARLDQSGIVQIDTGTSPSRRGNP
ncbi:MAG: 2-amino-4-hydroxy-6-hydroxymethyldihydropteridine diphosphokinase [Hyphomicrobiales bacterium]|nr:2-amino-4-hydroxy-6-hydroxymethyldihydropteridine diphosphokinase [Hyphomicrobiales bacterium]OQW83805.1 MAG: 2-amino-4-hydroxy-6-hydroxymethyldihydropteridine diphosphokinase [Proteobacteria bacterium ST_bin15]